MTTVISRFVLLSVLAVASQVSLADTIRVPEDQPTIQGAIDAASAGDQVRVGPGQWCGATVTKQLDLFGEGGATLIGCPSPAPSLGGVLRIGFFLPNAAASGTTIRHFVFDGRGVSNANFAPLSFAVFARDASNVVVEQNNILGTVQAITNTQGSGWTVSHNTIDGLTVFACDGTFCGGGDGIVFQERRVAGPRGADNSATFNVITGAVPNALNAFSMVGILALGQDGTVIKNNRISIPNNPLASGDGQAIVITDHCCGSPASLTSINSVIVNNDGRGSEFSVVIENDIGGGNGNSVGTLLRGNFGVNDINGSITTVRNRSIHTLIEF